MLLAHDSPIRHRPFARFWCARVLSTLAFQMMSVAVGWQVYTLTGRAFDLGLVGLAQFLPMLCLTLAVGQVADRYDRRIVVSICALVEAAAAATWALGGVLYVLGPTPVDLMVTTSFAAAGLLIACRGVKPAVRKKVAISLACFFSGAGTIAVSPIWMLWLFPELRRLKSLEG